jgi:alpha-glucosidase
LAETSYRCHIDLTEKILFIAEGPQFGVLVLGPNSPQQVLMTLADLTGHMPLPPKWALGYHQCRYSYTPDSRVLEIAHEFRDRDLPCDVIWLDIDYMDGFRCFTFNPVDFPEPERLTADLHRLNFHTVAIIDPGIKLEPGYFVYDSGTELGAWVQRRTGEPFIGQVWPGDCVFPDFTNAQVRDWWAALIPDFLAQGIDGIWNDMNEPAVFHVDSKTMPLDNHHRADLDLGGPGPHERYHNVYGMLMVRASREGFVRARPDKRPFILSRANYLGGQRYAAAWTGDNTASWRHLDFSIPMVLNLGLSGQPFSGPDIGGFIRAGSGRMFARWMGFGALLPFARGHTGKGNIDKEPWAFDPKVEETCRRALLRRYRLMPYLYTLFWEAATTGLPIARPLFFADPSDPRLRAEDDAFLLGANLLVVPQTSPDQKREPPLPEDIWRRVGLIPGDANDPDLPVLLLRGGAILPIGPAMEFVDEKPLDPLELVICLDATGRAEGWLYEDAGEGSGYQKGEFRLTRFWAHTEGELVTVTSEIVEGVWPRPARQVRIRVLTGSKEAVSEGPNSQPMKVVVPAGG